MSNWIEETATEGRVTWCLSKSYPPTIKAAGKCYKLGESLFDDGIGFDKDCLFMADAEDVT